ncbi:hypothetical protein, conserved [Eimeria praecox]|uniref:Uncharacterized protein n=1 Tax=Eimeria praecox TaxID=51316 RepID=U6H493_9EIME|nr:hypothetical protein, conserved [Eimeria praecox]
MLHSHRGPSRAPSLDYLDFGSSNVELLAQETGNRVAQLTLKRGQAPVGAAPDARGPVGHPRADSSNVVHTLLEDLLVRGLSVTVGLQPGSPEGPTLGLKPESVVLYLPMVRECQGPPKLHVRVKRIEAPGFRQLQICLSSSTVSFCTEWGAPSGVAGPDETVRRCKLNETLPAGFSSSAVASAASQITEPAAAKSCIVQLISSCGSLLCFKADPTAPMENQLVHDVLCIFRAFDFDTIRLYGCLCAAVKEATAHSQFEEFLKCLPLFALKREDDSKRAHAGKLLALLLAKVPLTVVTGLLFAVALPLERMGPSKRQQQKQEDGVRERHALICAFRRFMNSAKEKGAGIACGIVSGTECPSEGSSLGLDTTVPSEATIARLGRFLTCTMYCSEEEKASAKALNPHAAPFVPRVPFSTSGIFWGSSILRSTLRPQGPLEGPTAVAAAAASGEARAPAGQSKAVEGAAPHDCTGPGPHTVHAYEGTQGGQAGPQHVPEGPPYAGRQQRCKKSSSATTQRAPRVEIPGHSWGAIAAAVQGDESRLQQQKPQQSKKPQQQQQTHQSISLRRRSHSAPSRSARSAATTAKDFSKKCQYAPSLMLGLRRPSLLLQQPDKPFNFVLRQQQLQRIPDEPSMPCFSPSAAPAAAGPAVSLASLSPALERALAPCLPRPLNQDTLCAPPPPPLPRRQEGPLQHERGSQQQPKWAQPPGFSGGPWEGLANAGPLLPLPRAAPSGPPLLPTPRGPPISVVPFQQLDQNGLLAGYWGSTGPGATGAAAHTGVPWIPGSPGALGGPQVRPLLCPPLQYDGSRPSLQTTLFQQRDLLQQQLQNQLQQRLLHQGVPSAAFPEKYGSPNREQLPRVTRGSKSLRKGVGCAQQRRQKQSQQQQQQQQQQQKQQPLQNQSAGNKKIPDHRSEPFSGALPLPNEAALQKLLGMVTSLLMSRSGCEELRQQQQ